MAIQKTKKRIGVFWTIAPNNANARHEEADPASWEKFGDRRGNNGHKAEGYRRLNGPTWVGQALAARLTGMVECWNSRHGHQIAFSVYSVLPPAGK